MRIELEEPFRSLWRKGYLRVAKKDGRRRVDLVNSNVDRTTISYARYIKSVELGYILPKEFEVDHINVDCGDDRPSNLQVMTKEDHRKKTSNDLSGRDVVELLCPECAKIFSKERKNITTEQSKVFCSRSCNAKYSYKHNPRCVINKITQEIQDQITYMVELGYSGYRIAKELNISRNTAYKYIIRSHSPLNSEAVTASG